MGWGNCGVDSRGRPIGYCHPATCDHEGCDAKIDRGLAYACGGMHGTDTLPIVDDVVSCEGYFCGSHMTVVEVQGSAIQMCLVCAAKHPEPDDELVLPDWTEGVLGG